MAVHHDDPVHPAVTDGSYGCVSGSSRERRSKVAGFLRILRHWLQFLAGKPGSCPWANQGCKDWWHLAGDTVWQPSSELLLHHRPVRCQLNSLLFAARVSPNSRVVERFISRSVVQLPGDPFVAAGVATSGLAPLVQCCSQSRYRCVWAPARPAPSYWSKWRPVPISAWRCSLSIHPGSVFVGASAAMTSRGRVPRLSACPAALVETESDARPPWPAGLVFAGHLAQPGITCGDPVPGKGAALAAISSLAMLQIWATSKRS